MRLFGVLSLLLISIACAHGQEQENKLMERLLRPNMELNNDSQNKKFVADKTSVNKQASVGTFYVSKQPASKSYAGTRDFSAREYNAREFRSDKHAANTKSLYEIPNSNEKYSANKTVGTSTVYDATRTAGNRKYAGSRPFLGKGKSQKALSQHDTPLTIEQVRELLNKNK